MSYTRFALYAVPRDDALADFGARWLGWDVRQGRNVAHFPLPGIDDVTMTPRKYGFHGTIKPPFRLAGGATADALSHAAADLAKRVAPAATGGLRLSALGDFLALTPEGDTAALDRVAARYVRELDIFRAPAAEAEMTRRRAAGLSARQEVNLTTWGYPYVLDEFRFHFTLTGRLDAETQKPWMERAASLLPPQPIPFVLDTIALVGERPDGRFETIQSEALTG